MHAKTKNTGVICIWAPLFILLWTIALCVGIAFGYVNREAFAHLLMSATHTTLYFGVLLLSVLMPFVLVFLSSSFGVSVLVYPISICKAFFEGVFLFPLGTAFTSATWLIAWLLFFSQSVTLPVFIWYATSQLSGKSGHLYSQSVLVLIFLISVVSVDYYLISPYLLSII